MGAGRTSSETSAQARGYRASVGARLPVILVVAGLHVLLAFVVVHMFAPGLAENIVAAGERLAVTFTQEPPEPPEDPVEEPAPAPDPAPEPEGASAEAGERAHAKPVAAPEASVVLRPRPAPPVSGDGNEDDAGAADAGEGTGASGEGLGPGSGRRGLGQGGGGGGTPTVKIAGDISSARDYPRKSRKLRLGHSVVIDLRVGTEGRVTGCRVVRPSPDPAADRITCELAQARFRFRPATNGAGEPIPAVYRWQQRWFVP
ncbi:TonB family protein [Novosphingobium sp. MBES04]|uniref:TonB family protein n=1 Tax=Novosphingobium sp. MBES04 TaxID=1206458 RepID=UPI000A04B422|nr:TonB family protein [Novosphingobium sp. MBES04]